MTLEDAKLERLLRSTVGTELDAQRGRALAAFRNGNQKPEARSQNHWMRWWAGVAAAMAACLAVVLTAQFVMRPKIVPVGGGQTVAGTPVPVMDQVTLTRNVDEGTVVMDDGSPARRVRQQTVRKTEWFDPQEKATYSVTEPVEKVGYERLQPF